MARESGPEQIAQLRDKLQGNTPEAIELAIRNVFRKYKLESDNNINAAKEYISDIMGGDNRPISPVLTRALDNLKLKPHVILEKVPDLIVQAREKSDAAFAVRLSETFTLQKEHVRKVVYNILRGNASYEDLPIGKRGEVKEAIERYTRTGRNSGTVFFLNKKEEAPTSSKKTSVDKKPTAPADGATMSDMKESKAVDTAWGGYKQGKIREGTRFEEFDKTQNAITVVKEIAGKDVGNQYDATIMEARKGREDALQVLLSRKPFIGKEDEIRKALGFSKDKLVSESAPELKPEPASTPEPAEKTTDAKPEKAEDSEKNKFSGVIDGKTYTDKGEYEAALKRYNEKQTNLEKEDKNVSLPPAEVSDEFKDAIDQFDKKKKEEIEDKMEEILSGENIDDNLEYFKEIGLSHLVAAELAHAFASTRAEANAAGGGHHNAIGDHSNANHNENRTGDIHFHGQPTYAQAPSGPSGGYNAAPQGVMPMRGPSGAQGYWYPAQGPGVAQQPEVVGGGPSVPTPLGTDNKVSTDTEPKPESDEPTVETPELSPEARAAAGIGTGLDAAAVYAVNKAGISPDNVDHAKGILSGMPRWKRILVYGTVGTIAAAGVGAASFLAAPAIAAAGLATSSGWGLAGMFGAKIAGGLLGTSIGKKIGGRIFAKDWKGYELVKSAAGFNKAGKEFRRRTRFAEKWGGSVYMNEQEMQNYVERGRKNANWMSAMAAIGATAGAGALYHNWDGISSLWGGDGHGGGTPIHHVPPAAEPKVAAAASTVSVPAPMPTPSPEGVVEVRWPTGPVDASGTPVPLSAEVAEATPTPLAPESVTWPTEPVGAGGEAVQFAAPTLETGLGNDFSFKINIDNWSDGEKVRGTFLPADQGGGLSTIRTGTLENGMFKLLHSADADLSSLTVSDNNQRLLAQVLMDQAKALGYTGLDTVQPGEYDFKRFFTDERLIESVKELIQRDPPGGWTFVGTNDAVKLLSTLQVATR